MKANSNHIYQFIPVDEDTKQMKVNFETLVKKIKDIEEKNKSLYSELLKEVNLVLDGTIYYLYIVAVPDGDPNQNTVYPNMIEFKNEERLKSLVNKQETHVMRFRYFLKNVLV